MLDRSSDRVAALIAIIAVSLVTLAVASQWIAWMAWLMLAGVVAMLLVGAWWLGRQPPGTPFHDFAVPASVATVMPLLAELMRTYRGGFGDPLMPVPVLLTAGASALLGVRLVDTLPERYRQPGLIGVGLLATAGAVLGILGALVFDPMGNLPYTLGLLSVLAVAAATTLPGIVAGALWRTGPPSDGRAASVVSALELGVIGLTPAIALLTTFGSFASPRASAPLVAWILFVLAAQYLAVRPLARTATVATAQRDIVVAAMEAERSRIAADIHDDALQELTLLGWRLDAAGDKEGATNAREVADRLRAIVGDLRLPILDDLGAGPALEWLVERVERLAGGEVRLERGDQVRPPPEVELAFFRVAQEALSNAVRHGRPPIVVRYWTSSSGASLSVADSGSGFDPTRVELGADGHFGLLNMRQRAEQIGALLDVRRWPTGGTQVALEWRAQ
jgi:signal transduction histidine kinase